MFFRYRGWLGNNTDTHFVMWSHREVIDGESALRHWRASVRRISQFFFVECSIPTPEMRVRYFDPKLKTHALDHSPRCPCRCTFASTQIDAFANACLWSNYFGRNSEGKFELSLGLHLTRHDFKNEDWRYWNILCESRGKLFHHGPTGSEIKVVSPWADRKRN